MENLSRNVPFVMPQDGYVIAKAGASNNSTTVQLILVITANNLRVAEMILTNTPYSEVCLSTPYLKKGTNVNINVILAASSWTASGKGNVNFTII